MSSASEPQKPGQAGSPGLPGSNSPSRSGRALLAAIVLFPFVLAALQWVGADYTPVQDQAVAALRAGDVLGPETPLVGAFSRYGWSHPGPLWFLTLAPFTLQGSANGMVISSILVIGLVVAGIIDLVWRRVGAGPAGTAIAVVGFTLCGVDAFGVVVPWNPHLAWALFLLLMTFQLIAVRELRVDDLAKSWFVGALVVQLHVGYVLLAGVPLAFTTLAVLIGRKRRSQPTLPCLSAPKVWGWLLAAFVVWIPPLLEQIANGRDGNLARLVNWFLFADHSQTGDRVGLAGALGYIGGVARVPPIGLGNSGEELAPFTGWMIPASPLRVILPSLVVLAGIASAAVAHRRDRLRIATLCACLLATGIAASATIVGERWPYLFSWRFPLVWFVVLVSAHITVANLCGLRAGVRSARLERCVHEPARVLFGAAVALALLSMFVLARWNVGVIRDIEPQVSELLAEVREPDPTENGGVVIRQLGPILDGVGDAVLLYGSRAGWPVGVDEELGYKFGEHRIESDPSANVWLVTQGSAATSIAESIQGSNIVAKSTPLPPRDERELVRLQVRAAEYLAAAGRLDLVDAIGSQLLELVLDRAEIAIPAELLDRLGQLNETVESSGRTRMAIVDVGASNVRDYRSALEAIG